MKRNELKPGMVVAIANKKGDRHYTIGVVLETQGWGMSHSFNPGPVRTGRAGGRSMVAVARSASHAYQGNRCSPWWNPGVYQLRQLHRLEDHKLALENARGLRHLERRRLELERERKHATRDLELAALDALKQYAAGDDEGYGSHRPEAVARARKMYVAVQQLIGES